MIKNIDIDVQLLFSWWHDSSVGRPGTEIPIAQEAKDREREKILDDFKSVGFCTKAIVFFILYFLADLNGDLYICRK